MVLILWPIHRTRAGSQLVVCRACIQGSSKQFIWPYLPTFIHLLVPSTDIAGVSGSKCFSGLWECRNEEKNAILAFMEHTMPRGWYQIRSLQLWHLLQGEHGPWEPTPGNKWFQLTEDAIDSLSYISIHFLCKYDLILYPSLFLYQFNAFYPSY